MSARLDIDDDTPVVDVIGLRLPDVPGIMDVSCYGERESEEACLSDGAQSVEIVSGGERAEEASASDDAESVLVLSDGNVSSLGPQSVAMLSDAGWLEACPPSDASEVEACPPSDASEVRSLSSASADSSSLSSASADSPHHTKSKSEKPAVTLVYAFGWAHEVLRTLHGLFGGAILSSLLFSGMAMTTHFAGTGAAELAGHFLEAASGACIAPLTLRYVAACESSVRCQGHLREVLRPGSCIMVDILDRCPVAKTVFERCKTLGRVDSVEATVFSVAFKWLKEMVSFFFSKQSR